MSEKFTILIPPQDINCDPDCLERIAAGDREAYAWLYKNYCKKVYDYAMLMTANQVMSEDIVQEVFLKLWQHREKLKVVEDFNRYLHTLYRNYILDVLKRQQNELRQKHKYCRNLETVTAVDTIIDYNLTQQIIGKAVRQLPPQQQLVYKLGREEGLKRHQIANELKLSPFTVKAHMQLALRILRKKLSKV